MKISPCHLLLALLVVALGSGCRGARIQQLERRIEQLEPRNAELEDRIARLEGRVSGIEERMEPRVIPVPGKLEPQGK